ncbi:hypothetical protein JKP88DRAFT_301802 [Tribonema minus]|uniref:Methylenetetrahydrofolate reductase (NAD(P)H) n=1 Tax=Tribonema minus TaxID=303371 RepID=A0A835ZAG7_9STRA|nr:hypothetical protein JKP88DRAFT_301802 [Tribonema minus]
MRLEVMVKAPADVQGLLALTSAAGITRYNVPNKDKKDDLIAMISALKAQRGGAAAITDIVPHWSVKCQHVPRDKDGQQTYRKFCEFAASCSELGIREVLLVNGSGPKRQSFDTLRCLQLCSDAIQSPHGTVPRLGELGVGVGVAFNPYFEDADAWNEEKRRLQQKLQHTRIVTSVWLQFGSDPALLRRGLEHLRKETSTAPWRGVRVIGSVLVPSKQFLARMKFRPWNGLFLSEQFLNSVETAWAITEETVAVYREFGVEPIVETSVNTEADLSQVRKLLGNLGPGIQHDAGKGGARHDDNIFTGIPPAKKLKQ